MKFTCLSQIIPSFRKSCVFEQFLILLMKNYSAWFNSFYPSTRKDASLFYKMGVLWVSILYAGEQFCKNNTCTFINTFYKKLWLPDTESNNDIILSDVSSKWLVPIMTECIWSLDDDGSTAKQISVLILSILIRNASFLSEYVRSGSDWEMTRGSWCGSSRLFSGEAVSSVISSMVFSSRIN